MLNKIVKILKSFGPGFIVASLVLGPGSITVSSSIGSVHGYSLLWLIVIAAISMSGYTSMAARFGATHQESMLSVIGKTYGRWFSILISFSIFIAATSFQFGNNLGIGIGMSEITGTSEQIWPIIFTLLAITLIFLAKSIYKILEKLMMILVMVMIASFFINLILVKPPITEVARGLLPLDIPRGHLATMAALVATTFSLSGAFYHSYLVQQKGWGTGDLRKGIRDSKMGIVILATIAGLIIITSAAALHPTGIEVHSAADMARQLENLFGKSAKYVFSIGLSAAAFSSLIVNAIMGAGLLSDGLGLGRSMEGKVPKLFTVLILLAGMTIALFFKGDIIYALIIAQAATLLGVPLIATGMLLLLNNKKVMGEYANTKGQNAVAIFGLILICIMAFFTYQKIIGFLQAA